MSDFLVNNPDKPKAPRKPLFPPEKTARAKEILKKALDVIEVLCVLFGPGVGTFAVMNYVFSGAGLGTMVLGGIVGGIITTLVTKEEGGFAVGGIFNFVSAAACIMLPGVFFHHAAANVTMVANTTANVTAAISNSTAYAAQALGNTTANATAAISNSTAHAACALGNATAVSSDNLSCSCGCLVPQASNAEPACTCLCFDPQTARSVTVPAHSFQSFINATPVLSTVVGPVREAKARLSKKLKSYHI